ncbi:MAG: SprB repeat-containing protein, partial [Flavobacteriales bacterium]
CAGSYDLILRDTNGCDDSAVVSVEEPDSLSFTTDIDSVSCKDSCDGQITVAGSGGITPYSYSNDTGNTFQNSDIFSNLCANEFEVVLKDDDGCTDTSTVSVEEPDPVNISLISSDASCKNACDGEANSSVGGGTSPYSYQWDDPEFQTTSKADSLCAGTYQLIVTDDNSCEDTGEITVDEPDAMNFTTSMDSSTCGNSDGEACVTPSGGAGNYSYQWDSNAGNQTDSCANNLSAGAYQVVVTDANNCKDSTTVQVSDKSSPVTDMIDSSMVTCNGDSNGTAEVSVSGGTPPYDYNWSGGNANDSVVSDLSAGSYSVDVTDDNGCISSENVEITEPDALNTSMSKTDLSCNSECDGTATANVSGGVIPYNYSWTNSADTTSTADSLCAGDQKITVTDSNNCIIEDSISISQPSALSTSDSIVDATCNGKCDGEIHMSASGGTGSYQFSKDTGNTFQGGSSFTNLCADTFDIITKDDNGCEDTLSSIVPEPDSITYFVNVDSTRCNGACDGKIEFGSVSGGNSPYQFSIDNGSSFQSDSTFSGLCKGTYDLQIKDNNDCITNDSAEINEPAPLSLNTDSTVVSCNNGNDGSATVTPSGGAEPYSYSWAAGTGGQTDSTATGLSTGTYSVTVSDDNSCTVDTSVEVTENSSIVTSTDSVPVSCFGGSDGKAIISATGGTPGYTYQWGDNTGGQTGDTAIGLDTGTYFVEVTDALGCNDSDSVVVTEPPEIIAFAGND